MNQKGRSMIEMLGVLAIIGVLSVGGIAGYNKAMYKYRMNQTIQTITQAFQHIIELSGKNWGDRMETDISNNVKYGLFPAQICPEDYVDIFGNTGMACKLPLGEIIVYLHQDTFGNQPMGEFEIYFFEGNIVKSCVDFLSYGWDKLYPPEWLISNEWGGSLIRANGETLWSVNSDSLGGKTDNITLTDIQNVCDTCKGEPYCEIYMVFNAEY